MGATPTSLGPPAGQPYPGLIRPGTPGPPPSGMPPRQSTPTPTSMNPPAGSVSGVSGGVTGPSPSAPPTAGAPIQQQQPGPYPPYGPPGTALNQQPRQPSFGNQTRLFGVTVELKEIFLHKLLHPHCMHLLPTMDNLSFTMRR